MICSISRGTLLAVLVGFAGAATAASTSPVSLTDAAENASLIEIRHSAGAGSPVASIRTQYFASEEMSVSWDDQQVLVLCKEAAYLQIPPAKLKAGALSTEQRQMIVYQALMSGLGAVAGVVGPAGEMVAVADDGSETRSIGESHWAYGIERYDVTTQRMPGGALRVHSRKTETVNTTPPASPDDTFSTEDDQAARLSELAPVGSWTEVLIHGGPRLPHIDPATSLKGWVSMGDDQAATVAEARTLHGCK
ncbi:hypothetical protein ACVKU6_000782 [Stenotrophomonas sp. PvP086]|uniref:hypothetical protein n=1 Tax=Stenotrophomonas TaxID=40323 RepID=UPI0007B1BF1F|nr:hypothetical protein [Stenotrophomonas sp. PvP093]KZE54352.1 hypothetical protein AVW14_07855 [Stenotrophomonas maltophilia]TNY00854.1 hypothetical protein FIU09_08295 [Stenotrophomonas maltophilia]TPD74526.1 hypothetical protein FJN20_21925 [Stenotrophomonas maltophilia]TPD80979.1 hypothetical protein FJN21_03135 [Stenotrophomonas maltophilia]TPD87467.1 hypothetical protein FJN19_01775 [Stenotrophomonas maltophilia]